MPGVYNRKDHFYEQAKSHGYRSRAAYKLIELDKKFKLLKQGRSVLDLGSFPGGWLQVARERVGDFGLVVGIDLNEVEPVGVKGNTTGAPVILRGDITDPLIQHELRQLGGSGFDVVLSDMSPKLSGIRFRDAFLSAELVETAFTLSQTLLKPGGTLVAKIFPGQESDEIVKRMRPAFDKVSRENLDSSRKTSTEFYVVAERFRTGSVELRA